MLALPAFSEPFVLETDASNYGTGAELMQNSHPIAYISKGLSIKRQSFSVYERELLAIIFAVKKPSQCLTHENFVIKQTKGA